MDFASLFKMIVATITPFVLTAVVPLVIAGLKKVWANVPGYLLPIAAPIFGMALDFALGAFLGMAPVGNPYVAALMGALGVWLREVVDQAKKALA